MLASVKALLASIVDYAGLFPPAKLNMREAMANYAQDKIGSHSWMLGRFVLPASRFSEFEELLPTFPSTDWSLSVIVSGDVELELERVRAILPKADPLCGIAQPTLSITALEISPRLPTEIEKIIPHLPPGIETFFEIPLNSNLDAYLAVLEGTGASAKVRTGGITADAFPSATQLCHCIFAFADTQISFKATAGLHHPLPANYRLTYEPNSPSAPMHGFLNVAILAAFVYWQKITLETVLDLLQESSINTFQFTEEGMEWNNLYLNLSELETARQKFFRSFGSCSFQEPIEDLNNLALLS